MHGSIEAFSLNAIKNYQTDEKKCTNGTAATHGQEDCTSALASKTSSWRASYWARKERPAARNPFRPQCHQLRVAYHPFKDINAIMGCWCQAVMRPLPRSGRLWG